MAPDAINVVIAHDRGIEGSWVAGQIPVASGIAVAAIVDDLTPAPDQVQESDADVLLVACAEAPEAGLALVQWWAANRPDRPVVVLSHVSSNGFVGRAFRAGADDLIVVEPAAPASSKTSDELVFAIQKALARRSSPSENGARMGSLIGVLGPKGGLGKTLICCNLGLALAERGKRVVLVDLDLQFGDLALSLGLTPEHTMYDLATSGGSLDAGKIESFLAIHASGARVLIAPTRPDQAASVTIPFLSDVFAVLRASNDYVVVDTPPGFTPEVIASIDASSSLCVVAMLDALSLKNTKLGLETLELMGYDPGHMRLVLNRADSHVGITSNDVVSILGRAPDILIPSHRDVTRSVNEGTPIVHSRPRSEAAKAFQALAALYLANANGVPSASRRRSLLGRSAT